MSDSTVDPAPAGAAAPDAAMAVRRQAEVGRLHTTARLIAIVLTAAVVVAFMGGVAVLEQPDQLLKMGGVALLGFSGSGVGALTSLLSRYVTGLELESGERVPPAAEGELYHRRIAFAFLMRPMLGVLVAPLVVGGVSLFLTRHETFTNSLDAMMLVSFAGGLYAKSLLETAKNVFKVVFRA